MKQHPEKDIIEGCQRNERYWQEVLYRRYFPTMMRMVMRYANDQDTGMLIVNTGMLKVYQKINTYAFKGSFEGWMRRLVFHSVSDYYRKEKKHLHFMVFEERDQATPIDALNNLYEEDILALVKELPPSSANVFRLYAIEGYSHVEIAKMLGISDGTSKWHLSNARKKLQELLKERMRYGG